jgi:hypothetical protein
MVVSGLLDVFTRPKPFNDRSHAPHGERFDQRIDTLRHAHVQLLHQPQALLYKQVLFDDGHDQDLPVAPDFRDRVHVSIDLDPLDLDGFLPQAVLEEHMFFVDDGSDLHPSRFRPAFSTTKRS